MSDLFHSDVPTRYIFRVFDVMVKADWHMYQILTKRPGRLARMASDLPWPSHIWMGVSIETNRFVWRADYLRQVPSAVRFISAEPLLGPLDELSLDGIDWVITGGESGPSFRPCDYQWVADLRDRCLDGNIAFFHKQWGGRTPKSKGRLLDGRTWDGFPEPRLKEVSKTR